MVAESPVISLVLGELPLAGGMQMQAWSIDALGDDATWGNPQPVETVVQTLMQHGSSVEIDRYDNREVFIRVAIEAEDGVSLAEGEAALFAELGKRNHLTWTPPAEFAPPSVFRVVTSSMDLDFDDLTGELLGRRVYGVRLVCEPFARSVDEFTVDAADVLTDDEEVPLDPIDEQVDDTESLTGWTNPESSATLSILGSAVANTVARAGWIAMRRTGAIDMSDTPFLTLDVRTSAPALQGTVWVQFHGFTGGGSPTSWTDARPDAVGPSPLAGHRRYYYRAPAASIAAFTVRTFLTSSGRVYISQVRRQNTPPVIGTLRQKFLTATIPGSAPSQGTIEVWHPEDALGMTIVYSCATGAGQGFGPALRPYLHDGGPTTLDVDLVSGGREVISSAADVFRIPAAQVPAGTYEIGAWLRCNASGDRTISTTFTMREEDGTLIGGQVDVETVVNFTASATMSYFPLGRVQLPTLRVPGNSTALVQMSISALSGTVDLDDAYLFNTDRGALTRLDAAANTRVWLKAATIGEPTPAIMVGTQEDETDAVAAGDAIEAWGIHETQPPSVDVFVVTQDATDPRVRIRGYGAHHTHATS